MKVSECHKGQKVWRGYAFRSRDNGQPWYALHEYTVVSPEHGLIEAYGSSHVEKDDVFATKNAAIQHMVYRIAGYISELENMKIELLAKQIEEAA